MNIILLLQNLLLVVGLVGVESVFLHDSKIAASESDSINCFIR